jgi:uncharacterized repeat protein (TIGR04138 family)
MGNDNTLNQTTASKIVSMREVAAACGRYPEDAYSFVREGLEFAAQSVHGPMTPAQYMIAQYMSNTESGIDDVLAKLDDGTLDPSIVSAIEQSGGADALNRNVSGQDLCWAIRDYALRRWGKLSSLVLARWKIRKTADIGRIVFDLVENGFMQKEPHDRLEDFANVFDLDVEMYRNYRISDWMNSESI